jgi:hypothetical protein
MKLHVIPLTLADANACIAAWHRHHHPLRAHRFSLGVADETGLLRGVAVVSRPVGRYKADISQFCEVQRLATDGTRNACSMLLGAAARAARAMGYEKIFTYTLADVESGASLRGAGWTLEARIRGREWKARDGVPRRADQVLMDRLRWSCQLNPPRPTPIPALPIFMETLDFMENLDFMKTLESETTDQ